MDSKSLLTEEADTELPWTEDTPVPSTHRWPILTTLLMINGVLLVICASFLAQSLKYPKPPFDQSLYSPAQEAVKYKHVVFTQGFRNEKSKYQGPPNEAVDQAWEDLYEFGVTRIDKDSADQLVNKTSEVPDDPGYYITALDVFHQMHCLNNVRKAVWPEYYGIWDGLTEAQKAEEQDHLSHCVDTLRQAIMCFSDISTLYWEWLPSRQETFANARTTHVCRDFDMIKEWAMEHQLMVKFDTKVHQDGAPEYLKPSSLDPLPGSMLFGNANGRGDLGNTEKDPI